jgi:hypothetical protein
MNLGVFSYKRLGEGFEKVKIRQAVKVKITSGILNNSEVSKVNISDNTVNYYSLELQKPCYQAL